MREKNTLIITWERRVSPYISGEIKFVALLSLKAEGDGKPRGRPEQ